MKKHSPKPRPTRIEVPLKPIRYNSDYQVDWEKYIERLRQGRFIIENREIHGDAPKDFLRVWELTPGKSSHTKKPNRWPGYIAKVGSKWYPVESVTEHLITRIGQVCGVNITDSRLCILGKQVRFLSRYFLDDSCERLIHGLDLFRRYLDEETIDAIASNRREREEYTFDTIMEILGDLFPQQAPTLQEEFVKMLGFDAFVGNNDRHPMNWGVIVPVAGRGRIRFAPIYDSARGLFWNQSEHKTALMLRDQAQLEAYARKSQPQIGWNDLGPKEPFNHFDLIERIVRDYPQWATTLRRFIAPDLVARCELALEKEFSTLLSDQRRQLVVQCLRLRSEKLASLLPNEA